MNATKDTSRPTTSKTESSGQVPAPTPAPTPPPNSSEDFLGKIVLKIRKRGNADVEIISKGPIPLGIVEKSMRVVLTTVGRYNSRKTKERRSAAAERA